MRKQEFIEQLRLALIGRISEDKIDDNLKYYEEYINSQVRSGNTEESVLNTLGDPRLIAKTIITTDESSEQKEAEFSEFDMKRQYAYDEEKGTTKYNVFRVPAWLWLILIVVIVGIIISAFFSIVLALLPVVLPIVVVIFLIRLIKNFLS